MDIEKNAAINEGAVKEIEEQENAPSYNSIVADIVCAVVLFLLSCYVVITGMGMKVTPDEVWYTSPGSFPMFVGVVLAILSVILLIESVKKAKAADPQSKNFNFIALVRSKTAINAMLAFMALAIYLYVFLGNMPFAAATFLFLFMDMMIFRVNGYKIWKLVIICAVASLAITYGFGTLAQIPLP